VGSSVSTVLERHVAASPDRFCGIRHICSWDESPAMQIPPPRAPPGLMMDRAFREGFAQLRRYGLSFDAWQLYPQLPELVSLANAFPEVSIVANHAGGPLGIGPYAAKRDDVFADWKQQMKQLAACDNVVVKLGGLGMPRAGLNLGARSVPVSSTELAAQSRAYYLTCIDLFGPSRCMFESNFPVDKQSYSYCVLWNSFKRMTSSYSIVERRALFHDTAARFYKMGDRGALGVT
jgi:L-fuconolactonase